MERASVIVVLCLMLLLGLAMSVTANGIDVVQSSGGVWGTNHINNIDYVAVCGDASAGAVYMAARKSGGLDYVYWNGSSWTYTTVNNVTYRALCHDAVTSKYFYGAKPGGGVDIIYWNGSSWVTTSNACAGYFSALVPDRATTKVVYGNGTMGGVYKIYWTGSAWTFTTVSGSSNISMVAISNDGGVNNRVYGAVGCYGGLYAFAGGATSYLSSSCYAGLCGDRVTSNEVYGVRCDGWIDGIVNTTIYNLLSGIYSTSCTTDRTTTNTFYDAASTGPDCVWYAPGWTHGNLGTSTQYTAIDHDGASTKMFAAIQVPDFKTSTINFSNLTGVSSITVKSRFYGYQSCINRDYTPAGTSNQAYDYTVSCIKDTATAEQYRLYWGARFKCSSPVRADGDHVCQVRSKTGLANTWYMPHPSRPEAWTGTEQGLPNTWYYGNYLSPQVYKINGTYYLFTNCQIDQGKPIDIAGQVAACANARLPLFTSTDGDNWTRKTDRGVLINIPNPTHYGQTYEELIYEANDPDGKPWWLYWFDTWDGNVQTYPWRAKSSDPTTFDYNNRQQVNLSLGQFGNTMGVANEAPGGHLYVRISFCTGSNGYWVPSLEFSRDGLNWTYGSNGPVQMDGSDDTFYNYNCYNLGFSLINGVNFEYLGSNTFRALYFSSTSIDAGLTYIWYSEIGCGELQFTVNQ